MKLGKGLLALSVAMALACAFLPAVPMGFAENAVQAEAGYGGVVWRYAAKHEEGDLEPSEFCYVTFNDEVLLMRWNSPYDPQSIGVYAVRGKNGNVIEANIIDYYELDENHNFARAGYDKDETVTVAVNGQAIMVHAKRPGFENKLQFNRTEAKVSGYFPEHFIRKYMPAF